MEQWNVYGVRCADGITVHRLERESVRDLALQQLRRWDCRECGPHTLMTAVMTRGDWSETDLATPDLQTAERLRATREAESVRCPGCGVLAGKPCENLTDRRRGRRALTLWPHSARIEAAVAAAGPNRPKPATPAEVADFLEFGDSQ